MAKSRKRKIDQYQHADKERTNNPPVGLVTPATDKDAGESSRVAVKIIDDRGIESLRVIGVHE